MTRMERFLDEMAVFFSTNRGQTVLTFLATLMLVVIGWTLFDIYQRYSICGHKGAATFISFLFVPAFVVLLIYLLRRSWPIVSYIFHTCWQSAKEAWNK